MKQQKHFFIAIALICVSFVSCATGGAGVADKQDQRSESNKAGEAESVRKKIGALVAQLNSDDYVKREEATLQLKILSEDHLPLIRRLCKNASIEAKYRLMQIEAFAETRSTQKFYDTISLLIDKMAKKGETGNAAYENLKKYMFEGRAVLQNCIYKKIFDVTDPEVERKLYVLLDREGYSYNTYMKHNVFRILELKNGFIRQGIIEGGIPCLEIRRSPLITDQYLRLLQSPDFSPECADRMLIIEELVSKYDPHVEERLRTILQEMKYYEILDAIHSHCVDRSPAESKYIFFRTSREVLDTYARVELMPSEKERTWSKSDLLWFLGGFGDKRAEDFLKDILLKEKDTAIVEGAIEALERRKTKEHQALLEEQCSGKYPEWRRVAAMIALAEYDNDRAGKFLTSHLDFLKNFDDKKKYRYLEYKRYKAIGAAKTQDAGKVLEDAVEDRSEYALELLGRFYPDSAPFIFKQYKKRTKKYKQRECIKILVKMGTDESLGFVAKIIEDKNVKMRIRDIAAKDIVDGQGWRGGDVLLKTLSRMDEIPKELRDRASERWEDIHFWPVTGYAKCLSLKKETNFEYDKKLGDLISIGGPYLMLHLQNLKKQGKLDREYLLSLFNKSWKKPAIEMSSLLCTLLENEPNTLLPLRLFEAIVELHPAVAVKYIANYLRNSRLTDKERRKFLISLTRIVDPKFHLEPEDDPHLSKQNAKAVAGINKIRLERLRRWFIENEKFITWSEYYDMLLVDEDAKSAQVPVEVWKLIPAAQQERWGKMGKSERGKIITEARRNLQKRELLQNEAWSAGFPVEHWLLVPEASRVKWSGLSDKEKERLIAEVEKKLLKKSCSAEEPAGEKSAN